MKPIKAKKDFSLNGTMYAKGDDVPVKNMDELIKLNEKGFIDPMSMKEIQDYFKKPEIKETQRIFRKKEE